jgi:hypothetical protein
MDLGNFAWELFECFFDPLHALAGVGFKGEKDNVAQNGALWNSHKNIPLY